MYGGDALMLPKVMAIHSHPDDIEFMMAGTLFRLKEAGCELHYMNIADGCLGSVQYSKLETAAIRRKEAMAAAEYLGAFYHESLAEDLAVFYTPELIAKTAAVIREVAPDILLLASPEDYMEDHINSCRLAVTAAFCRGIPNYETVPAMPPVFNDIVLYHAMPYGLTDPLRKKVVPDFYIDISGVIEKKRTMLSCHKSQKDWLDKSQGINSYLENMMAMSRSMGEESGCCEFAEGWRRHSHLGYSNTILTPLEDMLLN